MSITDTDEVEWLKYFDAQTKKCRETPKENVFGVDVDNSPISFYEWMKMRGKSPKYFDFNRTAHMNDYEKILAFLQTYGIETEED